MRLLTPWILMIFICWIAPPAAALADEIILKSGEKFKSERIWKENGKIRFNMHGLVVSVSPEDVVRIIHSQPAGETQHLKKRAAIQPQKAKKENPGGNENRPAGNVRPPGAPARSENLRDQSKSPRVRGIGIDGVNWQMRPTEIPGIEKIKTDPDYGGIDLYARSEGNLKMGQALLDGLVFGFWQNRLYTITIWVDGKPAYKRLQQAVFHRYGNGRKNKSGLERFIWLEDSTDRLLEFDTKLNTGLFWMRSRELDRHIKQRYPD